MIFEKSKNGQIWTVFRGLRRIFCYPQLGMLTFSFSEKRSFRYENDDEKSKTKRSFF